MINYNNWITCRTTLGVLLAGLLVIGVRSRSVAQSELP